MSEAMNWDVTIPDIPPTSDFYLLTPYQTLVFRLYDFMTFYALHTK